MVFKCRLGESLFLQVDKLRPSVISWLLLVRNTQVLSLSAHRFVCHCQEEDRSSAPKSLFHPPRPGSSV